MNWKGIILLVLLTIGVWIAHALRALHGTLTREEQELLDGKFRDFKYYTFACQVAVYLLTIILGLTLLWLSFSYSLFPISQTKHPDLAAIVRYDAICMCVCLFAYRVALDIGGWLHMRKLGISESYLARFRQLRVCGYLVVFAIIAVVLW